MVLALAFALAIVPPLAARNPSGDSPARVYVFYSEPPFAYEPGKEIRVRILSIWDRQRKEDQVRKQVAELGGDVVVLTGSQVELDRDSRIVGTPTPRGTVLSLEVPTSSIFVVGRIGKRIESTLAGDGQRLYARKFPIVWRGVHAAVDALGWQLVTVDTDSRYLVTAPVPADAVLMRCAEDAERWRLARFTIYVNTYRKETLVRLDVEFADASSGEPAHCHSAGVFERVFFQKLEVALGTGP